MSKFLSTRAPASLRARLTLWVVGIAAVIQLTLAAVVFLYGRRLAIAAFEQRLLEAASDIARELESARVPLTWSDLEPLAAREAESSSLPLLELQVFDARGRLLAASHADASVRLPSKVTRALRTGDAAVSSWSLEQPHRIGGATSGLAATVPLLIDGDRVVLLASSSDVQATAQSRAIGGALFLGVLIGIVGTGIGAWFIAGLAIEPLLEIQELARNISPASLGKPIELDHNSVEVAALKKELDDALARLARAYESQERFLTNVSHEIKTPLSTVVTEAQVLRLGSDLPPDAEEFVRTVEDEMTRLARLVGSFLLLTRVRDAELPIVRRATSVSDLVVDSVRSSRSYAAEHGVRLLPRLMLDEDDMALTVVGDPDLLQTMVDNLVRNAIRFSPREHPVEITVDRNGKDVRLSVRDRGPGIPRELMQTLFDRFKQAPEERRRGRGSGLGLEIAEGIARLHGGRIDVENEPDAGCRFTIHLPIAESGRSG